MEPADVLPDVVDAVGLHEPGPLDEASTVGRGTCPAARSPGEVPESVIEQDEPAPLVLVEHPAALPGLRACEVSTSVATAVNPVAPALMDPR